MNPAISPSLSGDESCMLMLRLILKHGKEKTAMYIKMTFQFKCPWRGSFSVAMLGFRMVLSKHFIFNTCFCARGHRYMKHLACATTYWVSRDEQMVSSPHHLIPPELCQNNMNPHLNIFEVSGWFVQAISIQTGDFFCFCFSTLELPIVPLYYPSQLSLFMVKSHMKSPASNELRSSPSGFAPQSSLRSSKTFRASWLPEERSTWPWFPANWCKLFWEIIIRLEHMASYGVWFCEAAKPFRKVSNLKNKYNKTAPKLQTLKFQNKQIEQVPPGFLISIWGEEVLEAHTGVPYTISMFF